MKVGLFTDQYFPIISSVVTSVKMLYDGLTELGHECYIFTSNDEKIILDDSNIINIPKKDYSGLNIKRTIKKILSYNLDIIHVHTEYKISKLAIKAAKVQSIPLVHTLHMIWNDYSAPATPDAKQIGKRTIKRLKSRFNALISKNSTIMIVPNKKVLIEATKNGIHHCKMIRVIPTGIDLSKFYTTNISIDEVNTLRHKLGLLKKNFVLLCVSRFSEDKNINIILEAYSKVVSEYPDTRLLIVGGGSSFDELKSLSTRLNINDNVIFTGFVEYENLPLYYQLGDVFLSAAVSDSQGLSNLEALASSLPLLAQRNEVMDDILIDYYNGLYFDGINELEQKLVEIQKAPTTLKTIKKNTLKSISAYTKEEYSKRILNVYFDAIEVYNNNIKK